MKWIKSFLTIICFSLYLISDAQMNRSTGSGNSLEDIKSEIRIGAEFFIDPGYTNEEIKHHFVLMKEAGLKVVRLFIIWDHIERSPGKWDFALYDQAYAAAAENGLHILTTLCAEDPPGWTNLTPFYHSKLVLKTPEMRERATEYIRRVVLRYKDHPAQGPWSLQNEPAGLAESFDEYTLAQFGDWLKQKYGSIDKLNEKWFRPMISFDRIVFDSGFSGNGWVDYPASVDWKEFRIQQQTDYLSWVQNEVRKYDQIHPTHANPSALASNMPARGADVWSQKKAIDFIGTTQHASHQFGLYAPTDIDYGAALINDLMRSSCGNAPWWITELQAGLSLFGGRAINPTADEITCRVWDGIGAGAKGVIFWCWNPRRFGREGGEWGLVNADGSATPRSQAVEKISKILQSHSSILNMADPLPARVAILYNRQALVLASVDERSSQGSDRVILSLLGCHRALTERQIPVDFINEEDLKNGLADKYSLLYLPNTYAIDDDGIEALRRYTEKGGRIWADGPVAWKDKYGNIRPQIPGGLTEVFGIKVDDIMPTHGPFALTESDARAGDDLILPLSLHGAEILLKDKKGNPVMTRNPFGIGEAVFCNTFLTTGYHKHPDSAALEWITNAAKEIARSMDIVAETESTRIFFRGLKSRENQIAVLTNHGEEAVVKVVFRTKINVLEDIQTGNKLSFKVNDDFSEAEIRIPSGGTTVLIAK